MQLTFSMLRSAAFATILLCSSLALAAPPQTTPSADVSAGVTAAPIKQRTLAYDIYFGDKKAGSMKQTEQLYANGLLKVTMKSFSSLRFFFRTYKNSTHAISLYRNGQLQSFDIKTDQRGTLILVKGHRTPKGIFVRRTKDKKVEEKLFSFKQFEATSSDLLMPIHKLGKRINRKLLQIAQQKVVTQKLFFEKQVTADFQGKSVNLVQVTAQGVRGKATLLFTKQGRMFEMSAKIPFVGTMKISLREVSGVTL